MKKSENWREFCQKKKRTTWSRTKLKPVIGRPYSNP